MRRFDIVLVSMALLIAFFACEKDGIDGTTSGVKRMVSISYSLPNEVSTYGFSPTTNEQIISNLCLLFIKDNRCIGVVNGVPSASTLEFELPASVKVGEQYDIIALANPDSYVKHVNNLGLGWTATIAKLVGANLNGSAMAYLGTSLAANPQLMVAQASGVRLSYANTLNLGTLTRVFARVDIDATQVTEGGITFDGAYLDNQAAVAPLFAGWPFAASSSSPAGKVAASNSKTEGALYLLPTEADASKPWIIAEFTVSGTKKYYRIPLCPSSLTKFPIKSNYYYKIDITGLNDGGGASRDAASSSISYNLNGWENIGGKVVRNSDGSKMLSVGSGTIVLKGLENASGFAAVGVLGISEEVSASSSVPAWLNASVSGGKLTVTATSKNTDKVSREATVTLAAEGLSLPIKVVQTTPSNRNLSVTITDNSKLVFEPNGGSYNDITITTGNEARWKATSSDPSWLAVDNNDDFNGASGGKLTVTVASMNSTPSSEQRSGKITVTTDEGSEWSFTVVQKLYHMLDIKNSIGGSLTPTDLQFGCDGEFKTFKVTNERTDWTVTSSDNTNFAVSKTDNTFTVTAARQNIFGAAARSANITVNGENDKSITFKVTQEPVVVASNDEAVLDPTSNIYWYNRNTGATSSNFYTVSSIIPEESKSLDSKGLFFSYYDYTNPYSPPVCPSSFRYPTIGEVNSLEIKFCDYNQDGNNDIAYFDGNTRDNLKRRIFFPYAGRSSLPNDVSGNYMTSTNRTIMYLSNDKQIKTNQTGKFSVRCVQNASISAINITPNTYEFPSNMSNKKFIIEAPSNDWIAEIDNNNFHIEKKGNELIVYASENKESVVRNANLKILNSAGAILTEIPLNQSTQPTLISNGTQEVDCHWTESQIFINGNSSQYNIEVDDKCKDWLRVSNNSGFVGGVYSPDWVGFDLDNKPNYYLNNINNGTAIYIHVNENLAEVSRVGSILLRDKFNNLIGCYEITQRGIVNVGYFGSKIDTKLGVEQLDQGSYFFYNTFYSATSVSNGLNNTIKMRMSNSSAIDYCLSLNKDLDGDGILQDNEVKWYLPAVNQLMSLYVTEKAFLPFSYVQNAQYATSTEMDESSIRYVLFGHGTSGYTSKNDGFIVRCVRDL